MRPTNLPLGALLLSGLGLGLGLGLVACSSAATDPGQNDADVVIHDAGPDAAPVDAAPLDAALVDAALADAGDSGTDSGTIVPGVVASNFSVIVNRDVDLAPTPIKAAYVAAISATGPGDHIVSLQKYFKNESITSALLDAARRTVAVDAIYMSDVDPTCESLLVAGDTIDCQTMFQHSFTCHNKNMMILRADGSLGAIVGSYNLRERSSSSPRVHTVLTFDVGDGQTVFDWYQGAAERLLTGFSSQPLRMELPTDTGGELSLSVTPAPFNPVLEMLQNINSCNGIVWMSYYDAGDDTTGGPVFSELQRLVGIGCDVRVMVDEETAPLALFALQLRGIPARFPTFPAGGGPTLGHKIVLADSAGETHLIQSSANLTFYDVLIGNLTAYLRAPTMPAIRAAIETELLRYW